MKELSIEERAQRYDKAIERVVNIRTGKCETTFVFTEGLFNYLFPELEESNGEEVREAMIDFFKHEREEGVVVTHYGVNIERMIAWLEKQKTSEEAIQYLKENHSPSEVSDFQAAMNIAVAKAYDKGVKDGLENRGHTFTKKEVDDAYLKGVRDAKKELKKISQRMISAEAKEAMYGKPTAWSGEDSTYYDDICEILTNLMHSETAKINKNAVQKDLDWLVSIKDRVGCEANCTTTKEWSEKDDDNMMMIEDRLRDYLDYIREDSTLKKHIKNSLKEEVSEYIDWLKSIKQRIGG